MSIANVEPPWTSPLGRLHSDVSTAIISTLSPATQRSLNPERFYDQLFVLSQNVKMCNATTALKTLSSPLEHTQLNP